MDTFPSLMFGVVGISANGAALVVPSAAADPSAFLVGGLALLGPLGLMTLTLLLSTRSDESWSDDDRRLLGTSFVCAAAGTVICFVGLGVEIEPWAWIGTAAFALVSVGLASTVARRPGASGSGSRLIEWLGKVRQKWLYAIATVVSVLAFGYIGWIFWDGDQVGPAVAEKSYHVHLTCSDGVCSVNECTSPKACGKRAVGRLKEGEVAEITCQIRGGRVGAKGERSRIWDKLVDGNYVTDFYIDTPGKGRFTPGIPRCSEGSAT